ncbi:MAG: hypothetical protein ACT4QF_14105 [Sporichthyaceae bacterium]
MKLRRSDSRKTSTGSAALVVAGAVVAAVALPGGSAVAAPSQAALTNQALAFARFPDVALLPDSLSLDAPELLHGRLTDRAGRAQPGAQVLLFAWPSRETVRALPKRGEFDITPIARTVAGSDGTFSLRSALTPALRRLIGSEGLDLEVRVVHAGRQFDYLTDVKPVAGLDAWARPLLAAERSAAARNLLDIALDPALGERLSADLLRSPKLAAAASDADPFENEPMFPGRWCTRYKKIDTKTALETVATAVVRDGITAQTFYSQGAVTESAAGATLNGSAGFSAAGTRSHTSTISAKYPLLTSKKNGVSRGQYAAQVEHQVLEQRCLMDQKGNYRSKVKTAPDRTVGAKVVPVTVAPWKCSSQNLGDGDGVMTVDTLRAYKYERAFTFSPIPQATFTGSALSGYSKSVMLEFNFDKTGPGYLCGHTARPSHNGQMIQAIVR